MSIETTQESKPKQKSVRGVPVATALEVLTQALYYLAPHFGIATSNDDERGELVIRIRGARRDVVDGLTTFTVREGGAIVPPSA
jgi:hypothetical protein